MLENPIYRYLMYNPIYNQFKVVKALTAGADDGLFSPVN